MLDGFLSKTLNEYLATTIVLGNQSSVEIEFSAFSLTPYKKCVLTYICIVMQSA